MTLNEEHIEDVCKDIKEQFDKGITNCPLFYMALVPEGNPPANKAKELCRIYTKYQKKLKRMGVPSGVLVQATIGHGWVLSEKFPFQDFIYLRNGKGRYIVCPYDAGFREYIYDVFHQIAECNPDHIMLDDDFRLITHGGGCGCPLHLKRFNDLANADITGEELAEIIFGDTDKTEEYRDIFVQTQRESLIDTAKVMRKAIDDVNPKIQGSFCSVGNLVENGAEIAKIMSGEGNPVMLRLNNAKYCQIGAKNFTDSYYRFTSQSAKVKDEVDILLAETDTCPQNRYSTSAYSLHTHFTGSIIEGAMGAKHWITRFGNFYEPASGVMYRKILGEYANFYHKLSDVVPKLKWKGCRIPVLKKIIPEFSPKNYLINSKDESPSAWSSCVLERLGLPMYFSYENGGVLCLEGDLCKVMSDNEILDALKLNVLVASDSAEILIERGFGEYLGVDVREWTGKTPTFEKIYINGEFSKCQVKIKELVKLSDETESLSDVVHSADKVNFEYLFPGVTKYKNTLGGTVYVFSGTPKAEYTLVEAFSFLNYTRKQQLISILKETGEMPIYYPNDEEVYLRVAEVDSGELFVAFFNFGYDPIENIELVIDRKVKKIEKLQKDGTRKALDFAIKDDRYVIDANAYIMQPIILFIS